MLDNSPQSERSYATDSKETDGKRIYVDYDIPHIGTVRIQTLMAEELHNIKRQPHHMMYAAAIGYVWVDGNNDQINVVDDAYCHSVNKRMHSQAYDAFCDIINLTILNTASVASMVKN